MRAFVSALLVAALLLPLLAFISSQAELKADEGAMLSRAFAAGASRNAGETGLLAVKEIIRQTTTERMPRDARSVKESEVEAARRLALFEEFSEAEFGAERWQVDMWCGRISSSEARELAREMTHQGKALKCVQCWDAGKKVVLVGRGKTVEVNACAFAILVEPALVGSGRAGVGNSALSLLYDEDGGALVPADAEVAEAIAAGGWAIGVSVYDKNTGAASVRYVAPGEMEKYG
ncbi:MAG: hypothetical protein Q7T16_05765 [Candidatus Burarchaeum sp.]|nr:hypothetical protein [Candidatus Burarchaeum sp.]MDO8340133.1 hypothetical protein [Candidatus Burarchaeum sp.]